MNNLIELLNYGQSYWLDNLTREKINNDELLKRVTLEGLRGITSNPSIFNNAISQGDSYDLQIKYLVNQGNSVSDIYDGLTIKDVQDACDILKPVFDHSGGIDGFVSLEVSPYLAHDAKATIDEVHRLYEKVNRPNCYIKIPGTKEGIPAIEQMIYEGIPINITLLFSVERYIEIAEAYVRALQRRDAEGKPVNKIVSVASFFLSRIDVLIDHLLKKITLQDNNPKGIGTSLPKSLIGKSGVASARLAYQKFKEIFGTDVWKQLENKGAHVQRLLWASTGNKDPLFYDLRYVEPIIGKDTVNTMPDQTIKALADHGKLRKNTIEEDLEEAGKLFEHLKTLGFDIKILIQQLEDEGVQKFKDAFDELLDNLSKKKDALNKL